MKRIFYIITGMLLLFKTIAAQDRETPAQHEKRMQWWKEAKFGLFIHWGIYAVPAGIYDGKEVPGIGEWIMNRGKIPVAVYQKYAAEFNPVKFDADNIVSLAKAAGMRYIIVTSKHHDGFAMFKSNASNFNIVDATPFKRDVIAEMAAACKKQHLKFGLYYSQAQDWNHSGGAASGGYWDKAQEGNMDDYIDKIAVPQMKEILTKYGPISILWFDTPANMNKERAEKLYNVLKVQPGIIYNNRLGGGFGGDLETPEQYIPATGYPGRNWESCMTMNDTWGYKKNDKHYKTTKELVQNLTDIASKGGNYLLNIGPTAEGEVPAESVVRLQQVGRWMRDNGESIYGTTSGPFNYLSWGRVTRKGQTLYFHVFKWPADGILHIPLRNKINNVKLLSDKKPLSYKTDINGLSVNLPAKPDSLVTVVALQIEGEPIVPPIPSSNTLAKATASSVLNDNENAAKAFDGLEVTSWSSAKSDTTGWLQIDLGKPTKISGLLVHGKSGNDINVKAYQVEYQENGLWKVLLKGGVFGVPHVKNVEPVTAQVFRLMILKSSPGIQIKEMVLYSEQF